MKNLRNNTVNSQLELNNNMDIQESRSALIKNVVENYKGSEVFNSLMHEWIQHNSRAGIEALHNIVTMIKENPSIEWCNTIEGIEYALNNIESVPEPSNKDSIIEIKSVALKIDQLGSDYVQQFYGNFKNFSKSELLDCLYGNHRMFSFMVSQLNLSIGNEKWVNYWKYHQDFLALPVLFVPRVGVVHESEEKFFS